MREFRWNCPRCDHRNITNLEVDGVIELRCSRCLKGFGDPEGPPPPDEAAASRPSSRRASPKPV